jgi:diguanylate cyclase (GGDEF)-like protein
MRLASRQNGIDEQLCDARERIAELEAELAQASTRDQLTTRLLTLRAFRAQLELDVQRAHRYRRPLSLAVLDLDGFRAVNAKHGYGAGDRVLLAVAELIAERTRVHDLVCRMGGDEFAILLPETDAAAAVGTAERMLVEMEALDAGALVGVPASIGIAALGPGQTPERLLANARAALEEARSAGGGRASTFAHPAEGREVVIDSTRHDVVTALASALQERDRYTGEHSASVVDVAGRVADALALDEREIGEVRTAALLHDVGKVGVPDEVLHKPEPLDDREWELMREHSVIGERILRAIPGLGSIARTVRHEHERWDGGGYPDGLAGGEIPIGSRIVLACDAYHAMTTDRPYRVALSHAEALAELIANAGSQFDPQVVETLVGYLYGRRQGGRTVI